MLFFRFLVSKLEELALFQYLYLGFEDSLLETSSGPACRIEEGSIDIDLTSVLRRRIIDGQNCCNDQQDLAWLVVNQQYISQSPYLVPV